MSRRSIIVCSGAAVPTDVPEGVSVVELDSLGHKSNVHLKLENITKVFARDLSPRLTDLLEIAAYVYAADSGISRGHGWTDEGGVEVWHREFRFIIPVRDPEFWNRDDVKDLLRITLNFLSDDRYTFEFPPLAAGREGTRYLEFANDEEWPFYGVDRVLMFSGGLDSLAGAVQSACRGERLVLVSHRPSTVLSKRQRELFQRLGKALKVPMIHIPVWVNKAENLSHDYTQRTRSFLFAALGAVVAQSVRASGVRFFENGIVSINLPLAGEVQGARASRTTHPVALDHFADLFSLVLDRRIEVDNPFLLLTKADVVSSIAENGAADLIPYSRSCAHGYATPKSQWHCGTCSQCIDRRVAVLASGLEDYDPDTDYVVDVFTGKRKKGPEKNIAVDYARHAMELYKMHPTEIDAKFSLELGRAVRPFSRPSEVAERLIEMHKRHGATASRVLTEQVRTNSEFIMDGSIEPSSLVAMVAGQKHTQSGWVGYAERIMELLRGGLPKFYAKCLPKTELDAQQTCETILDGHDIDLAREFPYMRWSSGLAKGDWSSCDRGLIVELKYARKGNLGQIREDIAADITKYGDNNWRALFVIYDPQSLITDRQEFSSPVAERAYMMMRFVP